MGYSLFKVILSFIVHYSNGCVGSFNYLNAPITSVEWSPHDNSVLAVSSDEQLTIWDLSLEADSADQIPDVPPQLLFVHAVCVVDLIFILQGQNSIKELHFHPQIRDLIVSTAQDGFNCFIPDITVGNGMETEQSFIIYTLFGLFVLFYYLLEMIRIR